MNTANWKYSETSTTYGNDGEINDDRQEGD
jgi:hypothetical protein